MKHLKHLLTAALAMFVALVVATPAWAAGTGKITITPPTGTQPDATNSYKVYKVFDAVGNGDGKISYTVKESKNGALPVVPDTETNKFFVDDGGNVHYGTFTESATGTSSVGGKKGTITDATELTDAAITAIANYVEDPADLVASPTSTGTTAATATGLDDGYYYITTSTGTVVTIDSTNHDAAVQDKNTVPGVVKTVFGVDTGTFDETGKKALAQLGTDVKYHGDVTFGKGSKNVKFHDQMGTGLTLKTDSIVVTAKDKDGTAYAMTGKYIVHTSGAELAEGDTFVVKFSDGIPEGVVATIEYKATVNSDALTIETGKNTAKVSYGDNNNNTPGDSTNVYNAKLTVTKTDGSGNALAGAGFIISRTVEGKTEYYVKTDTAVTWTENKTKATMYETTASSNVIEFKGLASGDYTLIEEKVPAGYNKAADVNFTIDDADAGLTDVSANVTETVINQSGNELPSTGGIGTTIFYIVGGVMIVGAIIALITKKRVNSIEG